MYPYDFMDDEIVDYYITFLKSLSLRLTGHPIQLFYNDVTIPAKLELSTI
jgi:hypothetical protein